MQSKIARRLRYMKEKRIYDFPYKSRNASVGAKTVNEICRMAACTILRAFRSDKISLEFKAELGKHFILRLMPQKLESDGSFSNKNIIIVRNEKAALEEESKQADETKESLEETSILPR